MTAHRTLSSPVLTGRKIPGKHPRLAAWLYTLAYRIEALAVRWDDRYESPFPIPSYDDLPTTFRWGSRHADAEAYLPDMERRDA